MCSPELALNAPELYSRSTLKKLSRAERVGRRPRAVGLWRCIGSAKALRLYGGAESVVSLRQQVNGTGSADVISILQAASKVESL